MEFSHNIGASSVAMIKSENYISRTFKFEAAHRLYLNYDSSCKNIHGHSYKVKVTIYGKLNENSMILDFSELKTFQEYLDEKYDHSVILRADDPLVSSIDSNDLKLVKIDNSENPTAEKFAEEFAEKIMDLYNVEKVDVKVWETEKNLAGFTLEKLPRNY